MGESAIRIKSPEERQEQERAKKVSEYVSLTRKAAEIKSRMDSLKGWFEAQGLQDLNATKNKTVDYWCPDGKVEVGRSETVTSIAVVLLRELFGETYKELVKPKESLEMTADCKHLLAPIYLGNYIDTPIGDIIAAAVPNDEKKQEALRKKLRGNFKTDKTAFRSIAGLNEQDAEYYAYMAAESFAYDKFIRIMKAGGGKYSFQEAVDLVKTAVIVEEGVKVTVDAPEKV